MIRKRTAIFFILLANIVLLVHAVVPHHHHQEQICIVSSHCQADSHYHHHGDSGHDHQHDGNNESDCCVLKQAVAIPSNLLKQDCKSLDSYHPDFPEFQSIVFNFDFDSIVPIELSVGKHPFSTFSYTHFVTSALGLRGSPTV
jgi:hypothetical protein